MDRIIVDSQLLIKVVETQEIGRVLKKQREYLAKQIQKLIEITKKVVKIR